LPRTSDAPVGAPHTGVSLIRMRAFRAIPAAAVAFAVVLGVAGCVNQKVLTLTPDEDDLPACLDLSPIHVEGLGIDRSGCNLSGATLIFPDGTELPMGEYGGSGGLEGTGMPLKYAWVNVGDYGVVAAQTLVSCGETKIWGSREAVERVAEAFGDTWPCA
jgi:hypothetical protein